MIVIERAEEVLVDDPLDLEAFLRTLHTAGEHWSGPLHSLPFHVLLHVSDTHLEAVKRFTRAAAAARTHIALRTDF